MPNPYVDHVNGDNSIIDIQDKELRERADKTTQSATGNPISISGLKSNQLAVNPIITFEPIQAGSGTPSPDNVRAISGYDKVEVESCGKNILKTTIDSLKANNISSQGASWSGNVCTIGNTVFTVLLDNNGDVSGIKVTGSAPSSGYASFKLTFPTYQTLDKLGYKVGKTYTLSGCPSGGGTGANYNLIWNSGNSSNIYDTGNGAIFGVNTINTYYLEIRIYSGYTIPSAGLMFYPMTEEGTTKTTFEPYNKTTSISESLGQMVYGGTLDVRTGKFTVTHGVVDLGTLEWAKNTTNNVFYTLFSGNANKASDTKGYKYVSDRFVYGTEAGDLWNNNANGLCVEPNAISTALRIYARHTTYDSMTAEQFKTAMSGSLLAYELEISTEIQLTPHEISLLKDYAYVSTNGTNITLDYHNGELASLSDVSQLGETVNELGEHIGANIKANEENLLTHTPSTPYEFPCDGYVIVYSGSATSGKIDLNLRSSDDQAFGGINMEVVRTNQMQTVFVKKGMKAYLSQNTTPSGSANVIVVFRGLKA